VTAADILRSELENKVELTDEQKAAAARADQEAREKRAARQKQLEEQAEDQHP